MDVHLPQVVWEYIQLWEKKKIPSAVVVPCSFFLCTCSVCVYVCERERDRIREGERNTSTTCGGGVSDGGKWDTIAHAQPWTVCSPHKWQNTYAYRNLQLIYIHAWAKRLINGFLYLDFGFQHLWKQDDQGK